MEIKTGTVLKMLADWLEHKESCDYVYIRNHGKNYCPMPDEKTQCNCGLYELKKALNGL